MTDGYGQPPAQQPQQGGVPATQDPNQQVYYDDGYGGAYDYPGNTFRGMGPSDQAAQVRKALFELEKPSVETDLEVWIDVFNLILDVLPRIPGISKQDYNNISRRLSDIVERAHSQGRKRVVVSKCEPLLLDVRLLVSVSETPAVGMSGVGAMITTQVKQDQTIRMPQQSPQSTSSIWPWGKK
jgi:hypothetical protein